MVWLLRRCVNCRKYTLSREKCPYCNGEVRVPHPPKSSIYDKYREYRRRMREIAKADSGLG